MIDGLSSAPFSATTLPPIPHPDTSYVEEIIAASREQFSRPRAEVEVEIVKFHESTPAMKKIESLSDREKPSPKFSAAPSPKAPTNPSPVPDIKPATFAPQATTSLKTTSIPVAMSSVSNVPKQKPISAPANSPIISPDPELKNKPAPPLSAKPPILVQSKPQPASLSSLAPKSSMPKQDPKIPSKENINGLKNALAAALSRAKTADSNQSQVKNDGVSATLTSIKDLKPVPKIPSVQAVIQTNTAHTTPQQVSSNETRQVPSQAPQEVPEDVLKDVLKVD
jgi:hypothetical protein